MNLELVLSFRHFPSLCDIVVMGYVSFFRVSALHISSLSSPFFIIIRGYYDSCITTLVCMTIWLSILWDRKKKKKTQGFRFFPLPFELNQEARLNIIINRYVQEDTAHP